MESGSKPSAVAPTSSGKVLDSIVASGADRIEGASGESEEHTLLLPGQWLRAVFQFRVAREVPDDNTSGTLWSDWPRVAIPVRT